MDVVHRSPRPNKLRKQPPQPQPLSVVVDDLGPRSGPPSDPPYDPPSPILASPPPTPSRKLTKRRRPSVPHFHTVPLSSSAAAAAYAASAAMPPPLPTYTHSDIGHGTASAPSTFSTRRSSIIRRFSFRSSDAPTSSWRVVTAAKTAERRWGSASENGHSSIDESDPVYLPLVRAVSPFALSMPPNQRSLSHELSPTRPKAQFTLSNDSEPDLSADPSSTDGSHTSHGRVLGRPRLVRRDANVGGAAAYGTQRRRWTLATAMTDEGITDEVLVGELEKMVLHSHADWTGSVDDLTIDLDVRDIWGFTEHGHSRREGPSATFARSVHNSPISEGVPTGAANLSYTPSLPTGAANIPYTPSLPSFPLQHRLSTPASTSSAASWQTARRALLTCRELIRTERHYLTSLQALFASETDAPPPPLMLRYVGELVTVSEALLARMEENPSAWGVAAAFLGKQEGLEAAYVSWCGVVGGWFTGSEEPERGRGNGSGSRKASPSRRRLSKSRTADELPMVSPLMRTVSTWRKSMSALEMSAFSPNPAPSGSFLSTRKRKDSPKEKQPDGAAAAPAQKRKARVRDLAILPTQRVMRYVLLYRDLLAHTPSTSPSRALVERAVQAACRIAQKCDRAQGNAAFFTGAQAATSPKTADPRNPPRLPLTERRKTAVSMGAKSAPRMGRSDQAKNAEW